MSFFLMTAFMLFVDARISCALAADYPPAVQARLEQAFRDQANTRLERAVEVYNQNRGRPAVLVDLARKSGIPAADLKAFTTFSKAGPGPKAEWRLGEVVIEDGEYRLEIGPESSRFPRLRVNGKPFEWKWDHTPVENLRNYSALFGPAKAKEGAGISIGIANAYAEDQALEIQAAGLHFYFAIVADGRGDQLGWLSHLVAEMLAKCNSPEPTDGSPDPFMSAVMQATQKTNGIQKRATLTSCAGVKKFVAANAATYQRETPLQIPEDLCPNLDALAACARKLMDEVVTDESLKKLPANSKEWRPTSANPGNDAKRVK